MPRRIEEVQLGFESLTELDNGRIDRLVILHLQRVALDLMDRPHDKNKRKVTIDIFAEPVLDAHGEAETSNLTIEVKSKVPTYRSKKYEMRLTKSGFLFNRDFPEELDQQPLFDQSTEGDGDE